jgi:hypothetical protein
MPGGTVLVARADEDATIVRAGAVLTAARILGTVLVVAADDTALLVVIDAETLEAGAIVGAAVVRVAAGEGIVDTALDLATDAGAADGSLRALMVGAALGAGGRIGFAADQPFAALGWRSGSGWDDLTAWLAEARAARFKADIPATFQPLRAFAVAGPFIGAEIAGTALAVLAALTADRFARNTATSLTHRASRGYRKALPLDALLTVAAVAVLAAFGAAFVVAAVQWR